MTVPTVDATPAPGGAAAAPVPAVLGSAVTVPYAEAATVDHAMPPGGSVPIHLSPSRRIAQFVLLDRIGAGGMGEVFAAFDEKLERKVAIKLVTTQARDDRSRQRLLREAQALARLSHPNVVTVYEVGALPDGGLFIAMELIKGRTLYAWQRDNRPWRDIVEMYAAAGRGLAAAHGTGIVHRDFKPDNVLVGDDGRARVVDFGIAFAAENAANEPPAAGSGDPGAPGAPSRRPSGPDILTTAARFAGTPGYMAPEQLAGGTVDARADQYSFCVSLYEALHGARPDATRPSTAAEPALPRWLRDLLRRGLSPDPANRFATMDALLAELTRRRERTRRRVLVAAAASATITAAIAVAALGNRGELPPCPRATAEFAGVWDLPARLRSQVAILGTGAPFAASMWTSTAAAFDRYAQRWLGAQQDACEATHVRHAQSAELLDRRMECLAARRRSLAAASDVLQHRPAQAVGHAGEILGSLGDIEQCADTRALLELSGPDRGPLTAANAAARAQAAAVREQLAKANALLATGDVVAAAPIVATADRIDKQLDDDRVHAEVRFYDARLTLERGDVAGSLPLFTAASTLAVSSHHDEVSADVWLTLALHAGPREQRPAEIESWLAQAESWIQRLGHPSDSRRVQLEHARGSLQYSSGHPLQAVNTLSHAIQLAEEFWGPSDIRLMAILRDRADAFAQSGNAMQAVRDGEHAMALAIAAWGPNYPEVARTERVVGLLYIEQLGDIKRGELLVTRALAVMRDQLGADSIEVANCEQGLSEAAQFRGDYAAALEHAARAEDLYSLRLGPQHPRHGEALMNLGVARFMLKDFPGSLIAYQAAEPILRTALGNEHGTIGILHSNMGESLLALGEAVSARSEFQRALEILQSRLGTEHTDLALPWKGIGLAYLFEGQPGAARRPLEHALQLRTRSVAASDPQELAEIRWGLARTLKALGIEQTRSRDLAISALESYRGLGPEFVQRVHELEHWIASPAATQRPKQR